MRGTVTGVVLQVSNKKVADPGRTGGWNAMRTRG